MSLNTSSVSAKFKCFFRVVVFIVNISSKSDHDLIFASQHVPDKENIRDHVDAGRPESSMSARGTTVSGIPASSRIVPSVSKRQPQHVMKRKVLRKVDGQTSICESVTESEMSGK